MKKFVSLVLIFSIALIFICPIKSTAATVSDFSDVSSADWYYNYVGFVTQNGMFNGTSSASFSPNSTMTRGMFVTVLGRYGGAPSVSEGCSLGSVTKSDVNMRSAPSSSGSSVLFCLQSGTQLEVLDTLADLSDTAYTWYYVKYKGTLGYIRSDLMEVLESGFSDVSSSAYYYSYVQWAFSSGIAAETGEGSFSPERNITREEICTMLANYASYKNYQLKSSVSPVSFSDSSSISVLSSSAVSKLQQAGVVNGYGDGSFKPQGSATRAEVAALLMRFVGALGYTPTVEASFDSAGNYIFGTELPQKAAVGTDYFADACFIGHSLVNGMRNSFGLSDTDYYAANGASSKYLLTYSGFELSELNDDGTVKTGTLDAALNEKSYGKVYIMLGINEVGSDNYHRQNFYSNMNTLIDLVRKSQPNAVIYLISLTPVSQKCSENSKSFNRDNILAFNSVLKQLCKDKNTYYLNVFDLLCNERGFLAESACMSDGIHLLSPEYAKIKSYLLSHTV